MQVPLQITIRDIDHSDAVEQRIRKKAEKLNVFSDKIISCHVVVELTKHHQNSDKLHNVRITLTLPGKELVVNHNEQENLFMAIRDAFSDMVRQVEESAHKLHGDVKAHAPIIEGKIVRLFQEDSFGFIVTADGDEYYFNVDNVVHPKFHKLKVGMEVHFIEAMGKEGPQAHRVSAKV